MSIASLRNLFFSPRPTLPSQPPPPSHCATPMDFYQPPRLAPSVRPVAASRPNWLQRNRRSLQWAAGATVLGTGAVAALVLGAPVLLPLILATLAVFAVSRAVRAVRQQRQAPTLWVDDRPPSETEALRRREWAAVTANPPQLNRPPMI